MIAVSSHANDVVSGRKKSVVSKYIHQVELIGNGGGDPSLSLGIEYGQQLRANFAQGSDTPRYFPRISLGVTVSPPLDAGKPIQKSQKIGVTVASGSCSCITGTQWDWRAAEPQRTQ